MSKPKKNAVQRDYSRRRRNYTRRNGIEALHPGDATTQGKVIVSDYCPSGRLRGKTYGIGSYARLRAAIRAALNPEAYHPIKTLADMTDAEKRALEERYGAKIKA